MNQHQTEPTPHGYAAMATTRVTLKMLVCTATQKRGRASDMIRREVVTYMTPLERFQ